MISEGLQGNVRATPHLEMDDANQQEQDDQADRHAQEPQENRYFLLLLSSVRRLCDALLDNGKSTKRAICFSGFAGHCLATGDKVDCCADRRRSEFEWTVKQVQKLHKFVRPPLRDGFTSWLERSRQRLPPLQWRHRWIPSNRNTIEVGLMEGESRL